MDWDWYVYVRNNPVNNTDPTGHMMDDGCTTEGCKGDLNAIVHTIYMGGFPAVIAPNTTSYGERAGNSYDPQGNPDPSGLIGLINDIAEQGLSYKYLNDPKTIHAYVHYEENLDGSMNVTSLSVRNQSNAHVSLESVAIKADPTPCKDVCLSGQHYRYMVIPPTIGASNGGIGVVAPNSSREISLIPSGSENSNNSFVHNNTINIAASFSQYMPEYNYALPFRTLRSEINW